MSYLENASGQFCLWEPEECLSRSVVNGERARIDAGLEEVRAQAGQRADWTQGAYVGDGAEQRVIALGFWPRAVLLEQPNGQRGGEPPRAGLMLRDHPLQSAAWVTERGFVVADGPLQGHPHTNQQGQTFRFLAMK